MRIKKTYRKIIDSDTLVRVQEYNEKNNIIRDSHYEKGEKTTEIVYEYDNHDNLISETEVNDEGTTRSRFEFNGDKIRLHQQFFNDELFEEVRYSYVNNTTTVETFQEDELISRQVRIENEDKTGSHEHYDMEGKLVERQVTTFDSNENKYTTEFYNEDNRLTTKVIERTDADKRPLEVIYLNESNQLFKHQVIQFENGKITEIQSTDYYADVTETLCINEYDEKGNLTSQQLFNVNEDLIQDCHTVYNEKGDIIEESSHYTGGYNTAAGVLNNGRSFHFVYEIEY